MRSQPRNEAEPLIREAVRRAVRPNAQARESGAGGGGSRRSYAPNVALTDANGNTLRPMIWDLDNWDDPLVYW